MALPVLPAAASAAGSAGASAVAASAATAGSSLAAALGPIGLGISLISAGISYFSEKKAKKKAKKAARAALVQFLNFDGTNNFIPVVYGARRVEGTLVFMTTNDPTKFGEPNEYLYLVYVLCEGEVNQILLADILVDDVPVNDARFNFTNSISINIFPGLDNQTADQDFIDETAEWTADHKLSGLAYITVRLKWDRKAFNTIPTISAIVSGKKVFDTRTSTTAFSTNPALCIRDYLTNTRYGKGLDPSLIDDASITAAANFYDTTVTFYTGGTTGKVFEFNAIVDTEQSILDNLKDMMLCCRGFLPYTNGIYQLIPDKSASSVFAFTTNNIIGGISIRGENKADKYNRMICTFTDPTNNYQENTVIWPEAGSTEEIAFLLEDNGTELIGEIDLPYITNFYAARDLARVFLLRSRNAIRTTFNANSDALNVSVGDVVTVTHPTPGFSAKPFQVEEIAINYDGTCAVLLIEYDSTIYSYDPASEQLAYADTDLPNPFSVAAPTSLVITEVTSLSKDGSVIREIELEWTAADDAFVESYELQFKLSAATDYFSVFTFEPRYIATYGDVGEVYDYRIRAINSLGVSGAFLTGTYTTVGDTTAPAIPTGVTITGDYNLVTATWSAATEKDYKESWVYENTTGVTPNLDPNAPGGAGTVFRKVTGNTVTASGLTPNTTYYVWVRNVDFSDNRSGFSSPGTFTTPAGSAAASVIAGGTIAGSVTTDAVQISTIRTQAAAALPTASFDTTLDASLAAGVGYVISGEGGDYRLNVGASSIVAKHKDASEAGVAAYTGNVRTGLIITATGIAMGYNALSGAWVPAVSISATGDIAIRGDISATSGTFAGNLVTAGQVTATGTTTSAAGSATMVGASATNGVRGGVFIATDTSGAVGVSTSGAGLFGTTDATTAGAPGVLGDSGAGGFAFATQVGSIIINNVNDNMIIGTATNTGNNNLVIKEGTAGSRLNDQILIYGQLSADNDTTLGLVVEQDVEAGTGSFAGLVQLRIHINGVAYKLPLEAY